MQVPWKGLPAASLRGGERDLTRRGSEIQIRGEEGSGKDPKINLRVAVCERERDANEKLGLRIWASAPTPHSFQKGHGQGEKCGPRICKSSKCPCKTFHHE